MLLQITGAAIQHFFDIQRLYNTIPTIVFGPETPKPDMQPEFTVSICGEGLTERNGICDRFDPPDHDLQSHL